MAWAFQLLALIPIIDGMKHIDYVRFHRKLSFWRSVVVRELPQLFTLLACIPLGMWLGDYRVMLYVLILYGLSYTVLSHLVAKRPYQMAWDSTFIRKIFSFGAPLLLNGFLLFFILQGDRAIVGSVLGPEALGLFSAAYMLTFTSSALVTNVMQTVLLPVLSKAKGSVDAFWVRTVFVMQAASFVGLGFAIFFIVLGGVFSCWFSGSVMPPRRRCWPSSVLCMA
nr:oligosaccharide flippase family protein [Alkalilimnicola ehrlichii]